RRSSPRSAAGSPFCSPMASCTPMRSTSSPESPTVTSGRSCRISARCRTSPGPSLAFLAFVISWTPFFAAMFGLGLTRPAADPQPRAWLLVGLAGLWGLIYTPAAVTVAALTERMGSTLNPTLGIFAIHRMGAVYWQALIIFTAIDSDGAAHRLRPRPDGAAQVRAGGLQASAPAGEDVRRACDRLHLGLGRSERSLSSRSANRRESGRPALDPWMKLERQPLRLTAHLEVGEALQELAQHHDRMTPAAASGRCRAGRENFVSGNPGFWI